MKIGRKCSSAVEWLLECDASFGAIVFHSDSSCYFQFSYLSRDICKL